MKCRLGTWSRVWTVAAGWAIASGCGGSTSSLTITDAAADAGSGSDATVGDAPQGGDGNGTAETGATQDAPVDSGVADAPGDAGTLPACDPPADPAKASLCVVVAPEAIQVVSTDPSFDGKGYLAVDVHDTANPDAPDGASLPALEAVAVPAADAGGGEIDLSGLPVVRLDGLPAGVVYPRVIFVDSRDTKKVGAGWWLGGYDLAGGLKTPLLLRPVSLKAGQATTVTIDLVALRSLTVTLTRSVAPVGNAQGPAAVVATPDDVPTDASALYGAGSVPCADLSADAATVGAFVFGAGPYYTVGVLNDFGVDGDLPPGALTSLVRVDGGFASPPSARLQYARSAYIIQKTLDLDLAIPAPDAGADPVSCP